MSFRYRKSINLGGGIRLNLSKTGVGISAGVPGLRYSVHSSGRVTRTVGIPHTGLYWRDDHRIHGTAPARAPRRVTAAAAPKPVKVIDHPHKPGLFAPHGEKALFEAVQHGDADAVDQVARDHPELRLAAGTLSGLHRVASDPDGARVLLRGVFASGQDPAADEFIRRYVVHPFNVKVAVAPGVIAELPLGREAVGLVLAELDHRAGDLAAAITTCEELPADPHIRVALADLYSAAGRDADVVRITDGVTNTDEATALLLVLRGAALRRQGDTEAARQVLTEAYRVRSRDPSIR
ncbi:MAG TPA: DUF4236 domain-containing protein, partial [Acidimicrobiales bacterium]